MQEFPDMVYAYVSCQLDICLVYREVHDRTTSSDVEYRLIIFPIDSVQALYLLEKFRVIVQEIFTDLIASVFLKQQGHHVGMWPSRTVLAFTL